MTTFKVDSVSASRPRIDTVSRGKFFSTLSRASIRDGSIEAAVLSGEGLLREPDRNSFLETCLVAYDQHVPLVLSPDDVWMASLMAVTKHIGLHPEDARKALVDFEGKKLLEVVANDFTKGSPDNDWPRVFGEFAGPDGQIERYLGKKRDMLDPSFSTTTAITKAAMQIQTMAALSPYFDYKVWTKCGLPTVTLLGTTDDWNGIVRRVEAFGEFYPRWAHEPLLQTVTEFAAASAGNVNPSFWTRFVKGLEGSGSYDVSGEINAFFPYLLGDEPNEALTQPRQRDGSRVAAERGHFPGSVASVPVLWNYYGTEYKMRLAAGHVGTAIDVSTGVPSYRPITGWALGEQA
jgi:Domain of unknown function (DUF4419)